MRFGSPCALEALATISFAAFTLEAFPALTLDPFATLMLAKACSSISDIAITVMIVNPRDIAVRNRSRRRRGCGGRSFVGTIAVAPNLQRTPFLAGFGVNRILGINQGSSQRESKGECCQFYGHGLTPYRRQD